MVMATDLEARSQRRQGFRLTDCTSSSGLGFPDTLDLMVEMTELAACLYRRSQYLAQANSVAKMARPNGITMIAGPGNTIKAKPIKSTVMPTMKTATCLAVLKSK